MRQAFELYASGKHSYRTTANKMTEKAQELNYPLEKPFNPQMVRDMLQNRIYCGFVSYVETVYQNGFGQKRVRGRNLRQWVQGIHEATISEALFDKVQKVRAATRV